VAFKVKTRKDDLVTSLVQSAKKLKKWLGI
jgi:hypothetical protein